MTFSPLLRGILFCSTALATITAAQAQDCLGTASDQTCVNSGPLPDGIYDGRAINLTNTASGTINGTVAVQTLLGGNVVNRGSIDADVFGVLGNTETLNVKNSGTIHGGAIAIFGVEGANVTNTGELSGIFGIYSQGDVTAVNYGSIVGSNAGGDSFGILGENVDIENNGLISGGFNGIGIDISGRIVNRGSIVGTGDGADYLSFGIMARGNLDLANAGTIRGEVGVSVNNSAGGTVIDNDGWIIGTEGVAIDMTGLSVSGATTASSGNSLILRGKSKIDGAILLGDGDKVEIETEGGLSRRVTFTGWEGDDADVTQLGSGVFVRDGDTYSTLDTTSFAQQGQGLLGLSQGILAAAPVHGVQAPSAAVLSTKGSDGPLGWAGVFGASSHEDETGQTLASSNHGGGIVGGMTFDIQGGASLGLFAGKGRDAAQVEGSSGTDTDYRFAGVSVHAGDSTWFDASLIGGMTDSDMHRSVADNSVVGGLSTGTASYAGDFAVLHLGAGRDFGAGNVVWTPSVVLDAAKGKFDGFTETGTDQDLIVNDRDTTAMSIHIGIERRESIEWAGGTLQTEMSLAVVNTNLSAGDVSGSLMGQSFATDSGLVATHNGIAIGSGLSFQMSPSASLSLRGTGLMTENGFGASGALALNVRF